MNAQRDIRGVLISVTGSRLLLPNASVAEVITYSEPEVLDNAPPWLLGRVRWILRDEGFTPHPDKERVMRKGRRQEVTGLVVNADKPGVSRQTRRRLRAALHRATQAAARTSAESTSATCSPTT